MNGILSRSILIFIACLLFACGGVPVLENLPPADRASLMAKCEVPRAQGPWRLVHSIRARLPGGRRSTLIGVSAWDPDRGRLETALMAPEGILLFQGVSQDGVIHIERALPPLDRPGFAEGLFSDVRFLLHEPVGAPNHTGRDGTGRQHCRWQDGGRTIDRIPILDGGWLVREYRDGSLVREATVEDPGSDGFHANLDLRVLRPVGYGLRLTRIR